MAVAVTSSRSCRSRAHLQSHDEARSCFNLACRALGPARRWLRLGSPRAPPMTGNDIAVLLGFLAAAIALTGFAGIVTSIDRSAAVASNEVISFRVSNLVTSAVA